MDIKIEIANLSHSEQIEMIHLHYFKDIGEAAGSISEYISRPENRAYVALKEDAVVGYLISATYGEKNWFEWFGVSQTKQGIAKLLVNRYLQDLKDSGIKESILMTRNRFKDALVLYIKTGYEIKGITQANDGDLMLTLKLKI